MQILLGKLTETVRTYACSDICIQYRQTPDAKFVEIGVVEYKSFHTAAVDIDDDIVRLGEITKRMLHGILDLLQETDGNELEQLQRNKPILPIPPSLCQHLLDWFPHFPPTTRIIFSIAPSTSFISFTFFPLASKMGFSCLILIV
ncbi:MAG: hypothetical protein EXX96DRAFT_565653 [Benjaminiella poitrasii]|nr:MAG: hypothetical protein EXX96DRAFT_565653 [Benjaminiella poitrasii]